MSDKSQTIEPVTIKAVSKDVRRRQVLKYILAIFLCFIAGVGGGVFGDKFLNSSSLTLINRSASSDNTIEVDDSDTIAAAAAKVSPSVVSISTSNQVRSSYYSLSELSGAGTGIIVSEDGFIMTNSHVVENANSVSVIMSDGTTYNNVKVIGSDPLNDIAFLKISGVSGLTAAQLGDSSTVKIGQRVIAIGNALGQYQNTVTSGIISGKGRPVTASSGNGQSTETLTDLLQTDAAINSGNSGGPLVNLSGQVIGINTAVATTANGMGFAIPINSTKGILAGVLENGTIARAYLGVNYLTITPDVVAEYNLSVTQGAYVYAGDNVNPIVSGSPADKAGIKAGDIITKINDITVGDQGGIANLIGEYRPGNTVLITVLRSGETKTIKATLGSYNG
jgi:S1-C subfamily serine protease